MTVKLVVVIPVAVLLIHLLQGMHQKLDAMTLASAAMAENSRSAVGRIYSLIANQVVKKLTTFYRFNTSTMTYSDHQLAFIEFGNKDR